MEWTLVDVREREPKGKDNKGPLAAGEEIDVAALLVAVLAVLPIPQPYHALLVDNGQLPDTNAHRGIRNKARGARNTEDNMPHGIWSSV